MSEICYAPAPLFRDPVYDGAADPTIIWNHLEKSWWIVYTSRRANLSTQGVAWAHGTKLGIASSTDKGQSWLYRGSLKLNHVHGENTFWAPEIIFHHGIYHMYVSFVLGIPNKWGSPKSILHYSSKNLWDWNFESELKLSSKSVIDACVIDAPGQGWLMWYKDEHNGSRIYCAKSLDLYEWTVLGPAIDEIGHEGPNVFCWRNKYWMITDSWRGLAVYSSDDAMNWQTQDSILDKPGIRPQDTSAGHHADVLINNDNAFIFYFTHPEIKKTETINVYSSDDYNIKRSSLQVAKLNVKNDCLVCERNEPFEFLLNSPF